MNTFIQKLLTIKYKKQCPDIKSVNAQNDVITVYLEEGKVLSFKVTLERLEGE